MGHDHLDIDQQLTGLAGLEDSLRRALYRHVAERGVSVSRDDAAQAAGISRPLAAYHLDRDPPVRATTLDPNPDAAASC